MTFEPIASPGKQDTAGLLARLGVSLVDSGAIDRRTLDRARRVATETGSRLDQALTQLGLMSDRGLAEALAQLSAQPWRWAIHSTSLPSTPWRPRSVEASPSPSPSRSSSETRSTGRMANLS